MKTFLGDLAAKLIAQHGDDFSNTVVVFPNRRAILFFRNELARQLARPAFAPHLFTIEDFFQQHTDLEVPEKLELMARLHQAWKTIFQSTESLATFYFWGEMLLRDFDELDKYLIPVQAFFKDLRFEKQFNDFSELFTEEQMEDLATFWNMARTSRLGHERYMEFWTRLPEVYELFHTQLKEQALAYQGMLQREVIARLSRENTLPRTYYFAGFNVLTATEEKLFEFYASHHQTHFVWDLDAYYFHNTVQEAGVFFRQYQQKAIFSSSFQQEVPAHLERNRIVFQSSGCSSALAQTKILAEHLEEDKALGRKDQQTLIILGREALLIPTLSAVALGASAINVTMGFPLRSTPLPGLIESLFQYRREYLRNSLRFETVRDLLVHPYVQASGADYCRKLHRSLAELNRVWLRQEDIVTDGEFLKNALRIERTMPAVVWLRELFHAFSALPLMTATDRESIHRGLRLLTRLGMLVEPGLEETEFVKLFLTVLKSEKVPFSGEPLAGLQVMGLLETRNLDFDFVYILSLNEGDLPAGDSGGTFIPFSLRKAWNLPTIAHRDAIYSYLFYRSWQRAKAVRFYYTSGTDDLGDKGPSRYLLQLENEFPLKLSTEFRVLRQEILEPTPISIDKHQPDVGRLLKESLLKSYSPTRILEYIRCSLAFYFKYLLKYSSSDLQPELLDARTIGNVVHLALEDYFHPQQPVTERNLDRSIRKAFVNLFSQEDFATGDFTGEYYVIRLIAEEFANRVIALENGAGEFQVQKVEFEIPAVSLELDSGQKMLFGGKIDRLDLIDGIYRVVDYKTGSDKVKKVAMEKLFTYDSSQKGVFQLAYYAWTISKTLGRESSQVATTLYGSEMFQNDLNEITLTYHREELNQFEIRLKELMEELFNMDIPFSQTTNDKHCAYCDYTRICNKSPKL